MRLSSRFLVVRIVVVSVSGSIFPWWPVGVLCSASLVVELLAVVVGLVVLMRSFSSLAVTVQASHQ